MENPDISKLREKIDQVDYQLMHLLEQRAEIVKEIGDVKKRYTIPIVNGEREREILSKAYGFENRDYISAVFTKIFEESRKIQKPSVFSANP
jgi:chorismate mutase / prephenate dehydratase